MLLAAFNDATDEDITTELLACCDVPAWADSVRNGRPYPDIATLVTTADCAARQFGADDVTRALAAHPRIGQRATGGGTGVAWSRQEQSRVSNDGDIQEALIDGNQAYEARFGRVFLICASRLSGEQILAALRARLGNDDQTENAAVAEELRKIALLRLGKLVTTEQ